MHHVIRIWVDVCTAGFTAVRRARAPGSTRRATPPQLLEPVLPCLSAQWFTRPVDTLVMKQPGLAMTSFTPWHLQTRRLMYVSARACLLMRATNTRFCRCSTFARSCAWRRHFWMLCLVAHRRRILTARGQRKKRGHCSRGLLFRH